jgi:quercetin dioxygenase-like cupin family protein
MILGLTLPPRLLQHLTYKKSVTPVSIMGIAGVISEETIMTTLSTKAAAASALLLAVALGGTGSAQTSSLPKGAYSFGADQTIADISKMQWAPLQLQGLPPGIEVVTLHGDLAKGGGEILLRTPPKYVVPNHSHASDETYVWLKGDFTYMAADGTRQKITSPAFISLPANTPHALECGDEECVFYVRYGQPFDLHVHPMPEARASR